MKALFGTFNKDKVLVGTFSGHCPVDSSRQILVTILVWQYWWQCYSMQWQCDCDHVKLRSDVTTARNVATSARWQHARTVTRHTHISTHSYQFIRQTYPSISRIVYCHHICLWLVEFSGLYSSTYTKGDKDLLNIWKCFIIEQNHRREGRGKTEMKRLHNNHQKIIARDLARVWRWDSVLHLTPGITDGDHPIKIRSNLLNEGGWRTAACLHSISCNNYTPSGDWMSLVTFVLWFIHSKLAPISPGWSPTSRGNLKKKTSIGFFPLWNIPTFPQIPSENMLKGM